MAGYTADEVKQFPAALESCTVTEWPVFRRFHGATLTDQEVRELLGGGFAVGRRQMVKQIRHGGAGLLCLRVGDVGCKPACG